MNKFRDIWEQREIKTLEADRDQKIKTTEEDKLWLAENADIIKDDEEKHADTTLKELEEDQQTEDDDHKTLMQN